MNPILYPASAGTLESSDVFVEIAPAENGIEIDLNSVVQAQFGEDKDGLPVTILSLKRTEGFYDVAAV